MPKVAIEKAHANDAEPHSLRHWLSNSAERISRRAYELFQRRGGSHGSDQDDWFQAERELLWSPESELAEKNGGFEIQLALPGFHARDLAVTALRHAVVVRAEAVHQKQAEGDVLEIAERSLYRRFDLPSAIDVEHVTANLSKGVLKLAVPKAKAEPRHAVSVS